MGSVRLRFAAGRCFEVQRSRVIFVFEVQIKPGHTPEAYADAWLRASKLIQRARGARGTRLHRNIDDPMKLLAIASWDDKKSRDAMEREPAEEVERIIASQAPFVDIRVVGEFEDPEWTVDPPDIENS